MSIAQQARTLLGILDDRHKINSPAPALEIVFGKVADVTPNLYVLSAYLNGSSTPTPNVPYATLAVQPSPGDSVTIIRRPADGLLQAIGVNQHPTPVAAAPLTLDELDAMGLATDAELASHAALLTHQLLFNTPNTLSTDAGHWAMIASGSIGQTHGEVTAQALIGGGGSAAATFTRGLLRLRIRQEAAFGSEPVVTIEVAMAGDMDPSDIVLVTTSVAGPTTFEVHARVTRDFEWMTYTPQGLNQAFGSSLTWVSCGAFASALPSGTQYVAAAP